VESTEYLGQLLRDESGVLNGGVDEPRGGPAGKVAAAELVPLEACQVSS
jgi:hypothetical protein